MWNTVVVVTWTLITSRIFFVFFAEEEINAMKQALDKYGINMPAFGKIGGILANEMSDNDAALHAAIVAINEAIDHGNPNDTVNALKNPDAKLQDVNPGEAQDYQNLLSESKRIKCEQTNLKGKDESDLDMYDKMLTQAEIQGHLNKVNCEYPFIYTGHPFLYLFVSWVVFICLNFFVGNTKQIMTV